MKKTYFLFITLWCAAFFASAQNNVILFEDFESGETGDDTDEYATYYDPFMPDGWETISHYAGAENRFRWHNYYAASGTLGGLHCAAVDAGMYNPDSPTASGPKEEILLSPELDLNDTYQLTFKWKAASASALEKKEYDLQVRVIEVPADGTITKEMVTVADSIWSIQNPDMLKEGGVTAFPWTGWTVYPAAVDLSAWKGKKVKLAFVHEMYKEKANIAYIDNVKVAQFTPATTPVPELSRTSYSFGGAYIGSKVYSNVITLKNTGTGTLTITDIVPGSTDYSTTIVKEDVQLKKNDTYDFQLVLAPTALGGNLTTNVTLKTNGGDIAIKVQAIRQTPPAGYTFEGFENGVPPTGWTGTDEGWRSTQTALEGDFTAYCSGGLDGGPYDLITPRLDLSTGTHTLNYRYYEQFTPSTDVSGPDCAVKVYLSTDGKSTWKLLYENGSEYDAIINKTIDLGAPGSDNCYIKWEYENEPAASDYVPELSLMFLDCVVLPPLYGSSNAPGAATLLAPQDKEENIYTKNIELKWSPVLFAESYKVYVGKSTSDFSVVQGESTTATSFELTKADPATTYYWKVVPVNKKGEATDVPVWSFTTQADQTVKNFPWKEGFEGEVFPPLGWHMVKDGYTDWDYTNINPFDGKNSALATAGNNEVETTLETPDIVLPAEKAQISFYWGNAVPVGLKIDETGLLQNTTTESDGIDVCYFEIFADGQWTTLKMLSDKNKPYWLRERISLEAYSGKTVAFRWRYNAMAFFKATGVSLDNIVVEGVTAQKASFNVTEWNAGKLNLGESVATDNVFSLLNDGQEELTVNSVTFGNAGFQSTLAAGTKVAAGAGVQFALSFTGSQAGTIDDVMTIAFEGGYSATLPVRAEVMAEDTRFFGFESDEHGSLYPAGFTMIDVDKNATINMDMIDYPHYGEPFAFMVIDGVKCDWRNIPPVSGKQNLVAFGRNDYDAAEDWIVSAPMTATAESQFRFFARNYASEGGSVFNPSKVTVLVSTTSATDISTFETVLEEQELPWPADDNDYHEYTVNLGKYAGQTIYVAMRHTVTEGLAALFDDFFFEHFSYFAPTGIDAVEAESNNISVYPNPVADMLYVDSETPAAITVYSETGVMIMQQSGTNRIDLSDLKAGFYLLTVDNADGRHTARVIKK